MLYATGAVCVAVADLFLGCFAKVNHLNRKREGLAGESVVKISRNRLF